jgi:hypothetical protein
VLIVGDCAANVVGGGFICVQNVFITLKDTWTTSALQYTIPGRDSSLLNMALVTATEEVTGRKSEGEAKAMSKLKAMKKPKLKGWSAIRAVVRPVEGHSSWGALLSALHCSTAKAPSEKQPQEWKQLAGVSPATSHLPMHRLSSVGLGCALHCWCG